MKVGKIKGLGGYGIEVPLQDNENKNKNGCHAELRRSMSAKANKRCTGPRSPFDGAQGDTHFILLRVFCIPVLPIQLRQLYLLPLQR